MNGGLFLHTSVLDILCIKILTPHYFWLFKSSFQGLACSNASSSLACNRDVKKRASEVVQIIDALFNILGYPKTRKPGRNLLWKFQR